jgi:hypothetical protein
MEMGVGAPGVIMPLRGNIAFAKSSFLFFPLPPVGGEGQGEGEKQKLLSLLQNGLVVILSAAKDLVFQALY